MTHAHATRARRRNAKIFTVGLPALLACGGPSLYLPLLAFAGAGPTTLLFGLLPPLAALRFRSSARSQLAMPDGRGCFSGGATVGARPPAKG